MNGLRLIGDQTENIMKKVGGTTKGRQNLPFVIHILFELVYPNCKYNG
jgi:hypothetical protein